MNKSRQYGLFTDVPDELWNDWHWQVANRIETLEDLKKYISLTPEEEEGVAKCLGTLRMAITPYYLSLINPNDPYDPVRRQCIPSAAELYQAPEDQLSTQWNQNLTSIEILLIKPANLPAALRRILRTLSTFTRR